MSRFNVSPISGSRAGASARPSRKAGLVIWHCAAIALMAFGFSGAANAAAVFAPDVCAGDRAGTALGCTANDSGIGLVEITNGVENCIVGQDVTLTLSITLNSTQPKRYDLGVFIAEDGLNPAVPSNTGGSADCATFTLPIGNPGTTDSDSDLCADLGNNASTILTGVSVTVPCVPDANGNLNLNSVVTWDNNSGDVCNSNQDVQAATSSKCSANVLITDVQAVTVGTLTVIKDVTPDDAVPEFNFTVTGLGADVVSDPPVPPAGPGAFALNDGESQIVNSGAIPLGGLSLVLTETTVQGFAASYVCRDNATTNVVVAGSGAVANVPLTQAIPNVTCTVTNASTSILTLVKTVTNDDGGTATTANFTLTATGPVTITGVTGDASITNAVIPTGTYALTETNLTGYTAGSFTCDGGSLEGNSLSLGAGVSVTCTINNNDQSPTLTLVKTVTNDNGGTATTGAFTLTATGPTTISGVSGSPAVTDASVDAGAYTLTETNLAGYAAGTFSCQGGSLVGNVLTLGLGATATCTINNNDVAPTLTLVKTVTNDNGGTATTGAFTLSATGPTVITGVSGSAAVTNAPVSAGVYDLDETNVTGYTEGPWSCVKNGGGAVQGSSITLASGDTATCTINNNDQAAALTLVKTVTNDSGGTAVPADFTLTATGPTTISGASGSAAVTNAAVSAGQYTLTESNNTNYTAGTFSCEGGSLQGNVLTLGVGQSATCTINNNDKPPSLTLVKTVTNDNGGTATTANFTLTATGPVTITGVSGSGTVTAAQVPAGNYTLTETNVSGYTAGTWNCVGGSVTGNVVTVTNGAIVTCTINNNDQAASLTLVKIVTNNNGGAATTANFTLTATGPTTISGLSGTAAVTNASVSAGVYTLSESNVAGYTAGTWSCDGLGEGGQNGNELTLGVGGEAICTITNDDQPAVLTLAKTVINNNTGVLTTAAFTLTATGPTTITGVSGSGAVTAASVSAGSYTLTENVVQGYALASLTCSGGSLAGNVLTLGSGQTAVCTFTNDDITPFIPVPMLSRTALLALALLFLGFGLAVVPRYLRGRV